MRFERISIYVFTLFRFYLQRLELCSNRERGKRGRKKRKKQSSVKKRLLFARRISDSSVSRYSVACIAGDRSENRVEKMKRKKNMERWMLAVRLECGSPFLFVSHEEVSRESRFLEEGND